MKILKDEDVIEFYTKEMNRESLMYARHGNVPEIIRNRHFFVSIQGRNWYVQSRHRRETKAMVRVFVRRKHSDTFEFVMHTETVVDECSPCFTSRLPFQALNDEDSQNEAIDTTLRIDGYVNDTHFFSVHVTLAQLVWDMRYETTFEPYCAVLPAKRVAMVRGALYLNVSRSRSTNEEADTHEYEFNVALHRHIWNSSKKARMKVAICAVAGYGRWSCLYISPPLAGPAKHKEKDGFLSFRLKRGDLTCYNPDNPVRIELRGIYKGASVVLGFSQVQLGKLSEESCLPWNKSETSHVSAQISILGVKRSQECSSVSLAVTKRNERVGSTLSRKAGAKQESSGLAKFGRKSGNLARCEKLSSRSSTDDAATSNQSYSGFREPSSEESIVPSTMYENVRFPDKLHVLL